MVGILITVIVVVCSTFLSVKLRFLFFRSFGKIVRDITCSLKHKSVRRSFLLALSGTLGVGNVVGVAVGLICGGKGSVFWLVASAFISVVLKYSETSLSSCVECGRGCGMMALVRESHSRLGFVLSIVYAISCIGLSFVMGAMLQSSSVCASISRITGLNKIFIAVCLCLLVIAAVIFKSSGIIRAVSWILPIASVLYLSLCLVAIVSRFRFLAGVLLEVFASAFNFSAFGGGVFAFLISSGIKEGFSRGLLSNEAGAGTSSLGHGVNSVSSPASIGILGMGEVIADTVVFCPMTALAILVLINDVGAYTTGVELVLASVGAQFSGADVILSVCIFFFAYATVICWFYYGTLAVKYVFSRGVPLFSVLYIISIFLGAVLPDVFAVRVSDVLLLILTAITCVTLIKRSDSLVLLSERAGLIRPHL